MGAMRSLTVVRRVLLVGLCLAGAARATDQAAVIAAMRSPAERCAYYLQFCRDLRDARAQVPSQNEMVTDAGMAKTALIVPRIKADSAALLAMRPVLEAMHPTPRCVADCRAMVQFIIE